MICGNSKLSSTHTLPTPAGGEASHRPPPAERGFRGTFCQWQRLVATELPSGHSLPLASKFLKKNSPTPTLASGSERSSPVHCLPPPTCVGRVSEKKELLPNISSNKFHITV